MIEKKEHQLLYKLPLIDKSQSLSDNDYAVAIPT